MRSLRFSLTVAGVNQMNEQKSMRSAPWPTSDSILNKKLAGWAGVTVLGDAEISKNGTGGS